MAASTSSAAGSNNKTSAILRLGPWTPPRVFPGSSINSSHVKTKTGLGQLTGSERILNDTIVDYHGAVNKWKYLHVHGTKVLAGEEDDDSGGNRKSGWMASMLRTTSGPFYRTRDKIMANSVRHRRVLEEMVNISQQLLSYTAQLEKLSELEELKKKDAKPSYSPSWRYKDFAISAKKTAILYAAESEALFQTCNKTIKMCEGKGTIEAEEDEEDSNDPQTVDRWNTSFRSNVNLMEINYQAMLREANLKPY